MAAEPRTLEASAHAPEHLQEPWELVVVERQGQRVFRLPERGIISVGRGPYAHVRIDDNSVSREHACIHLPSLEVEDLGSRNGSWLVETGSALPLSALVERSPCERERLSPGVRRRIAPGALLKLGDVVSQLQRGTPASRTLPAAAFARSDELPVLEDAATRALYALAERTAATALPLLILGETGVGKDVLAARIHQLSPRKAGPFVRINCGALSESLLESELFGHQRGAFTGASDTKPGLFELGHGGSVFLDEIGELPLRTQVKLLHVLETSHVTRLGATKPQRIDVRFIAATNRELARDVQAGTFRKDLYFRINTLCLKLNPLRERPGDVLPLVRHFLRLSSQAMSLPEPELLPETAQHLQAYAWPGNVRELKNSVERARLLCGSGPLLPEHFPSERELLNPAPNIADLWADAELPTQVRQRRPLESGGLALNGSGNTDAEGDIDAGHAALVDALNSCGGNQTRAAELLGISRRTLVNRLNEFKLPRPRKRGV